MSKTTPGQASLPFSHEEEVGMPRDTIRRQAEVIDMLKEQIARLTHDKYGSGSERSLNGTLDLAEDEPLAPEAGEDAEEKPSAPLKRTRRLRADITRVVEQSF